MYGLIFSIDPTYLSIFNVFQPEAYVFVLFACDSSHGGSVIFEEP